MGISKYTANYHNNDDKSEIEAPLTLEMLNEKIRTGRVKIICARNTPTRKGTYYSIISGMIYNTYFVGLDEYGLFIIEIVGCGWHNE
jgi:hypothetical protein